MKPECRVLGREDAILLLSAVPGVFDNALNERLVSELLADPRHHLIVALEDGRVVGFVSAVHYINPDKPAELWINEVSVAPDYQGHGLGRRMMEMTLNLGRELGCKSAWVLTDESNRAALRLYRSAGGIAAPSPSIMFEFPLAVDTPDAV